MQMLQPDFGLETNLSSQSFTLGDPAKMFSILADKIYSDKPRAIVRELACNALDAQPNIPFKVSLPSHDDPTLSIRDYGPGLSKQKLFDNVCQFFWSDKTGTNDQIGGFGLGMKSPLSYTETFTIHSYQAGTKSTYIAFRDNTGIPQITEVSVIPTSEADGLEICVPIKPGDFNTFRGTARGVLRWFPDDAYELYGANKWSLEILSETPFYKQVNYENVSRYYVQMGPVAYEVDWSQTDIDIPMTIIPIFQVGELDLPPSRETLSYDARTVAKLTERAQLIRDTFVPNILAQVPNLTPPQRLELVDGLKKAELWGLFREWRDAEGITAHERAESKLVPTYRSEWGSYLKVEDEVVRVKAPGTRKFHKTQRYGAKFPLVRNSEAVSEIIFRSIDHLTAHEFFFADVTDKIFERLIDTANGQCMVISDQAAWDELKTLVPPEKMRMLSEGYAPLPEPRKSPTRFYYFNGASMWVERTGSLPTSGIYFLYEGTDLPATYLAAKISQTQVIYAFNKTAWAKIKIKDRSNFVSIQDHVAQRVAEIVQKPAFHARATYQGLHDCNSLFRFAKKTTLDVLPDLKACIRQLEELSLEISAKDYALAREYYTGTIEDQFNIHPLLEKTQKRNPLLMLVIDQPYEYYNDPVLAKAIKS